MQIVKPQQDLFRDLLDERHGDSPVVPPLDQAQKVLPQHFEHHANMRSVGTLVLKRIQEADDMFTAGVVRIRLDNFIQKLDLVDGGFRVMRRRSHNLERNVLPGGVVSGEPDGREVAPS